MAASKTRGAPRAPRLTAEQIAREEAARKAARKAKRDEAKAAAKAKLDAEVQADVQRGQRIAEANQAERDARKADEAKAFEAALRVDARAILGEDATEEQIAQYVAEQMAPAADADKQRYSGPMIALVAARKHYTKAANGILCNGSPLAMLCGQFERAVVVDALVAALKLPGNPYLALNPGQQSMNLRNKARHALAGGTLTMAEIEAALKARAAK